MWCINIVVNFGKKRESSRVNPKVENGSGVGVVKEVLWVNPGIGLLCFGSGGKLLSGDGGGEAAGVVVMMRR